MKIITLHRLPRCIHLIFFAKILMTAGNFVYPFLTLYLTKKLNMHQDVAGLFFLAATIGGITGSISGGVLSDYIGRKEVLVSALFISGLCYFIVPFISQFYIILFLIIISLSLLSAAEPALNALVGDMVSESQRKDAFSCIYMGHNIGFALGPLVGGFLFFSYSSSIFVYDGIATCLAALVIWAGVKYVVHSPELLQMNKEAPDSISFFTSVRLNPVVVIFCLLFCAHPVIYSQTNFSFPIFLDHYFQKGAIYYGMLMTVNGLLIVVLTPVLTSLTKRVSSIYCVASGIALYAIGFGIYFFTSNIWFVIFSVIIWSIGEILAITNAKIFIVEHSDITHRGRFNTMLDISLETGFGIGPVIAGKIITTHGIQFVWPVMMAISITASAGLFLLSKTRLQLSTITNNLIKTIPERMYGTKP